MSIKLSQYCVTTPCFFDEVDQRAKRIVFATRTSQGRLIDEAGWKLLESGAFDQLPPELLSDLVDAELLVPSDEDELATIVRRHHSATREDDILSMVIQPTAWCQLGCGYCGQEHTPTWLNRKHQDSFVERLQAKLASQQFRHLQICWFGAEPLSGISVIRSLTPRLKAVAEEFGCTYGARIITNGLALTEKIATEIVNEHAIKSIDITLDGTADFHDARRHQKNGRPTFDAIFANVVNLALRDDLDLQLKLRSNVDATNCDGISGLIRMLAEAGVQKRLSYYVAPIHSWGNDADKASLSPQEFAAREIAWFCEMIQLGFSPGLVPPLRPVVCLAVQPHGELIDATGTLFNCTEVSYVPAYGTPNTFAIGHVSSGELPGRRELLGDFNARVGHGDYPCSSCRMLPVCGGACPKAWLEGHEPCPSAKRNIEERLMLAYAASRIAGESDSLQDAKPASVRDVL